MVDGKRNRKDHKLNLVIPRRGLSRSKSVLSKRRGIAAKVERKQTLNNRSNSEIVHETGHALNWLDSLIRKGRGILDSLEEEEDAFEKEVIEERHQLRIREQLVESVLNEPVLRSSGYGTDTSFKRLDDTIRNSLTNSSDDLQDLRDLQDERQGDDVAEPEVAILPNEDEDEIELNDLERSAEAEEDEASQYEVEMPDAQEEGFEQYEAEEGEEIELVSSEEEQEHEDQEHEHDHEASRREYINQEVDEYESEHGRKDQSDESDTQRESEENHDWEEENEEFEIAKKLASGLFSELSHSSDIVSPSEDFDTDADPTSVSVDKNMEGVISNRGNNGYQGFDGPQRAEEIIIVEEEHEEHEEQLQQGDLSDNEQGDQAEGDHSTNTEGTSSLQMFRDSYDYQTIATQAMQQFLDTRKDNSGLNSNDSLADSTGQIPEEEEEQEEEQEVQEVQGVQEIQEVKEVQEMQEEKEEKEQEQYIESTSGIHTCEEHEAKKRSNSRSSLFEQLFKPKSSEEDRTVSAASFEDESIYYSLDEHLNDESLGKEAVKENARAPPYEILFCESTYSSSSNEDNEQSVPDYVSPFAENPFIAACEVDDKKEVLRRTLESLGESFDSESEDQRMKDAQDISVSSNDEYFSQTSEINLYEWSSGDVDVSMEGNDSATIKDFSVSPDADTASEKTVLESVNIPRGTSLDSEPQLREPQNVDGWLYGSVEPDVIEEYESQQGASDLTGNLVLEEINSDTEISTYPLINSDPHVEFFSSQPQSFVNIILDEFTAPDLVEEVESESENHNEELMVEEISPLLECYPLISREPVVEYPESLSLRSIKIVEITELSDQRDDVQVSVEGNINLSPLGSCSSSETFQAHGQSSLECNVASDGQESSTEQLLSCTISKISFPSRALNSVISRVKSVGNVLTDFVKTIDVLDSDTDSDSISQDTPTDENHKIIDLSGNVYSALTDFVKIIGVLDSETESDPGGASKNASTHDDDQREYSSENSNSGVESGDVPMVNHSASQELGEEYPVVDQELKKKDVLSEITTLRRLARAIENKPVSRLGDKLSSELEELGNSGVVKSEKTNNQLEVDSIGAQVIREDENLECIKLASSDGSSGESEVEFAVEENKDPRDRMKADGDELIKEVNVQDGILRGESIDSEYMNDKILKGEERADKQVDSNAQDGEEENSSALNVKNSSPTPLKHIDILSNDSEDHLKVAGNRETIDGAVEVPVGLELEECEVPSSQVDENINGSGDNQKSSEYRDQPKKKNGRKRKSSAQNSGPSKRKSATAAKPQKKRSKGPITRSSTNPPPTSRRTRRNNRLRKTR